MPISYTKRGWTNNSPPAINAANLGAMDDGIKAASDTLNNPLSMEPIVASAAEAGSAVESLNETDKIRGYYNGKLANASKYRFAHRGIHRDMECL